MQGQKITFESLPETHDFEVMSASNNSLMADPQVCWSNMINGENLATYLPPDNLQAPFENVLNADSGNLSGWNIDNRNNVLPSMDENALNEAKMDYNWTSLGGGPSVNEHSEVQERRLETNHIPSLENTDANIVGSRENTGVQNSETVTSNFFRSSSSDTRQILLGAGSSDLPATSPGRIAQTSDVGDSRRLSYKRKNIGGVPGQSFITSSIVNQNEGDTVQANSCHSLAGNWNISGSSGMTTGVENSASNPTSESNPTFPGEIPENLERSFRLRTIPADQQSASFNNLQLTANLIRSQNSWHRPLSSLLPPPVYGWSAVGNISSHVHPQPLFFSGPLQHPIFPSTPPTLRSSNSTVSLIDRFIASREDANMGSLLRSNLPEPSLVPSRNDFGATQDQAYWGFSGGSINSQENMTSTSELGSATGRFHLISPATAPLVMPSNQYQHSLEFIRQALTNSASQNSSHLQGTANMSSLVPNLGIGFHSQQQTRQRFSHLMDRQNDAVNGDNSSLPRRERRSRLLLSEFRSILGALRRGEDLRPERDAILDHSILLEAVDLHDRHRDMRLDVDNMTYEELLALEERIGSVNTGLSEEAIVKCLKLRKHSIPAMGESPEVEPCCICQEDYAEGEEVGRLDCGHDFHTACVKHWLKQKNLCPICKTEALTN